MIRAHVRTQLAGLNVTGYRRRATRRQLDVAAEQGGQRGTATRGRHVAHLEFVVVQKHFHRHVQRAVDARR